MWPVEGSRCLLYRALSPVVYQSVKHCLLEMLKCWYRNSGACLGWAFFFFWKPLWYCRCLFFVCSFLWLFMISRFFIVSFTVVIVLQLRFVLRSWSGDRDVCLCELKTAEKRFDTKWLFYFDFKFWCWNWVFRLF